MLQAEPESRRNFDTLAAGPHRDTAEGERQASTSDCTGTGEKRARHRSDESVEER